MECPYCEKELNVLRRCYVFSENYHKSVSARTECCHNLVRIIPRLKFEVVKEVSKKTEDDWGMPIKELTK